RAARSEARSHACAGRRARDRQGREAVGELTGRLKAAPTKAALCGRAPDVLGARTLRALSHLEFHAVAFAQVGDAFPVDRALMEEVVVAAIVLDEPEALV